jgi:hypothetical protein
MGTRPVTKGPWPNRNPYEREASRCNKLLSPVVTTGPTLVVDDLTLAFPCEPRGQLTVVTPFRSRAQ